MASPDAEIKDGLSIPIWMKTKPPKDFEPFAASPPAPEDSFFYIRYPKTEVLFGNPKFSSDLPVIDKQKPEFSTAEITDVKEKDWSKHTKPCQDVLHSFGPINTAVPNLKPKPAGVDDGFKGERAACGSSVVKVANQMIQSKSPRGFTVAAPADDAEMSESLRRKLMTRRNSKSLPATPAHTPPGSPTSRRKNANRFFTSPYEPVEEFGSRSWLTMALLGFKKDLTTSTSTLAEEEHIDNRLQTGSLAESVENLGPAPKVERTLPSSEPKAKPQNYRPKPSELREMNFWSPTSM